MSEYFISRREINRRVTALTSLIIVWLTSQLLLNWIFLPEKLFEGSVLIAMLGVALAALWGATVYFFYTKYIRSKILLGDGKIVRVMNSGRTTVKLTDVTSVATKMTTRGAVREVRLTTKTGKQFSVDGLEEFSALNSQIIKLCPNAKKFTIKEPADFDHPAFYPILGLLFAVLSNVLLNIMQQQRFVFIMAVAAICAGVCAMFITVKPLARQYGRKAAKMDYVAAVAFGVAFLGVALLGFL